VRFHIHKSVYPVVGFRITGEDVFDLVAVHQETVYSSLEHGIALNVLSRGLVPGVENGDAFPEPPVELVGSDIKHFEYLVRTSEFVQECSKQRTTYGTRIVPEYPFVFFVREELPLEFIVY